MMKGSLTNEKARFWLIMFICNCYTLNTSSFRVTQNIAQTLSSGWSDAHTTRSTRLICYTILIKRILSYNDALILNTKCRCL